MNRFSVAIFVFLFFLYCSGHGQNSAWILGIKFSPELTTLEIDKEIPDSPTNLIAIIDNEKDVHLNWTDNSNNESGFEIQRFDIEGNLFFIIMPQE